MNELTPDLVVSLTLSTVGLFIGAAGLFVAVRKQQIIASITIGACLVFFLVSLMIRYNHYFGWFASRGMSVLG